MFTQTKRVTAGFNDSQESVVLSEDTAQTLVPYPQFPSFQLQELFYTEHAPPSLATRHFNKPYDIQLPEGALRMMKIRMPTIMEMTADLQAAGVPVPNDWTTFNLHRTDSIDYLYVLSGAITCIVGTQRIDLKVGDFLTQVGAEHTWVNDNEEACYVLCIMIGIRPGENA